MRVLYCTGGGVGNVVMSTPAIAALAEMGHEVDVLVGHDSPHGVEDLLRGWAPVANVSRSRPAPLSCPVILHSVWHRERIGIRCELFAPTSPEVLRVTHEAEANMVPVRELGYTGPTPPAHVEIPAGTERPGAVAVCHMAQAAEAGRDVGPDYFVIAPGCKQQDFWRRKRWEADQWIQLCDILGDGAPVFCLGLPGDYPGAGSIDLTGKTSLAQAALVMKHARAVVAIDNGLAHVAAALGVPTVVLFGATSEVKNRPLGPRVRVLTRDLTCRPCQMTPEWDACTDWRCMDFEAEDVAEAVGEVLR